MRLRNFLPKDAALRKITIGVLSIHFLFFIALLFNGAFLAKKHKHKPLIVKTVVIQPAMKVANAQTAKKALPSSNAPLKPKTAPPTADKIVPAPPKKTPPIADRTLPPAKAPAASKKTLEKTRDKLSETKKPRPAVSKDLLQELEKSISQIESKKEKLSEKNKSIQIQPQNATQLQIDKPNSNALELNTIGDPDYTDALIQCLHESLHLPEFGDVKIQLTLRQDGSVAKLVVLNAESEKNKTYLESNLPRLKFPPLQGAFAKKKESTFCLNFCNEI